MTKIARELSEASHAACEKMREDLEILRKTLVLQQVQTAELDTLIDQLMIEGQRQ